MVERANILLQAADGKSDLAIAAALRLGRHKVARWRARFLKLGIPGIEKDAARPGRTRTINAEEIVRKTTQEKPDNATHWSTRTMARAAGLSEASVRRIWHAHGLKPHLVGYLQDQSRSAIRREIGRYCRVVSEPAATGDRILGGREESDSSLGSDAARFTHEERPRRDHDP